MYYLICHWKAVLCPFRAKSHLFLLEKKSFFYNEEKSSKASKYH